MKLNNIRYTDEDINNLDDYFSEEIEGYREIEKSLNEEINKQKEVLDKIKEYIKNKKEEYNNETELSRACINGWHYCELMNNILELLEEIE